MSRRYNVHFRDAYRMFEGDKFFWVRSQRTLGLRHELSSLARTLCSWVRIPLKAWISVCVYSVCVVLCVGSGLATVSLTDCVKR
jgi:hypothetical protein